jgi:hypothetical protein
MSEIANVKASPIGHSVYIPREKFDLIIEELEDLKDTVTVLISHNTEELFPSGVVKKLANGENPLKTWREYRKMTIEELANKSNIGVAQLTSFEINGLSQTEKLLPIIATALNLDAEDFIWNNH